MHRIFVHFIGESGEVILDGDDDHYLRRVLRLGPEDRVIVFDQSRSEWIARIVHQDRRRTRLALVEKRENRCEPVHDVRLLQGIPKGTRFFDVVRDATAMGVSGIVPFEAMRSVAGKGGKSGEWHRRAKKIAMEAARQCGRCNPPSISEWQPSLKAALDQVSPESQPRGVFLWEETQKPVIEFIEQLQEVRGTRSPILLIIGPEGGFTRQEAELAEKTGLFVCHLGPRILRTELAPVVALSILMHELGEMSG